MGEGEGENVLVYLELISRILIPRLIHQLRQFRRRILNSLRRIRHLAIDDISQIARLASQFRLWSESIRDLGELVQSDLNVIVLADHDVRLL